MLLQEEVRDGDVVADGEQAGLVDDAAVGLEHGLQLGDGGGDGVPLVGVHGVEEPVVAVVVADLDGLGGMAGRDGPDLVDQGGHVVITAEVMAGCEQVGEDDDVGIVDSDVLVALNYEAFEKMNAYAHAIRPQGITLDKIQAGMVQVFAAQHSSSLTEDQQILPIHPTMTQLHSHIMSSAGRIYHEILDEAATLAHNLGGGGLVFCKSGKDRTAMHGK